MRARLSLVLVSCFAISAGSIWIGCGGGSSSDDASADAAAPPAAGDDGTDPPDDDEQQVPDDAGVPPPIPNDDGGAAIPSKIRYVMVLVKENHTFENYFTGFPGADTSPTGKLSNGNTYTRPVAPTGPLPSDLCHSNHCATRAYSGGSMDGFDLSTTGKLPFVHYTEQQIPNYWQYARNFVLADHFFSSSLAPSTPGHTVFWAGRSLSIDNATCNTPSGTGCTGRGCTASPNVTITTFDPDKCTTSTVKPCFDVPSIIDHLPAGFTWMDYGTPMALMVKSTLSDPHYNDHLRSGTNLLTDLQGGHIANLTIAHLSAGNESEHPPAYPCAGENQTVQIINAAMKLPQWNEMAIVVTWDDWGGFYDHVKPPIQKCPNTNLFNNGFRLPALIVSPYAKKGFVLSTPAEQASVPRLVEELWGMTFMTARDSRARDGTAGSLMGAFDFTQPPRAPLMLQTHTCP